MPAPGGRASSRATYCWCLTPSEKVSLQWKQSVTWFETQSQIRTIQWLTPGVKQLHCNWQHCLDLSESPHWEGSEILTQNAFECKGWKLVRLGLTKSQGTSPTPGGRLRSILPENSWRWSSLSQKLLGFLRKGQCKQTMLLESESRLAIYFRLTQSNTFPCEKQTPSGEHIEICFDFYWDFVPTWSTRILFTVLGILF